MYPRIMTLLHKKDIFKSLINKKNKHNIKICQNSECNEQYKNKKLISISPGGLKGFYLLGISTFIKENYCLDNYVFSGASAGAWNALYMSYKGEPTEFINKILNEKTNNAKTVIDVKNAIKENILENYKNEDFELEKIFVGVKTFSDTVIYSNFENIEDAIDCCIASSHIPFITGGMLNLYHNKYTFDGGFSEHPYLKQPAILHITPNIWENNELDDFGMRKKNVKKEFETKKSFSERKTSLDINQYTTLFSRNKYDFLKTYQKGYEDTALNKHKLDYIFSNDKYE